MIKNVTGRDPNKKIITRDVKRQHGKPHTSIHKTVVESFCNSDGDIISGDKLKAKIEKNHENEQILSMVEREKLFFQQFLHLRGLPFEYAVYNQNGLKLDYEEGYRGHTYSLEGYIENHCNEIAGASLAAQGLNHMYAVAQYYKENKCELALQHSLLALSLARAVNLIEHEKLLHAGFRSTNEATKAKKESKVIKKDQARKLALIKIKANPWLSKTEVLRIVARELGWKEATVIKWFSGEKLTD